MSRQMLTKVQTTVHTAAYNDNTQCLQVLIDSKADVDARDMYGGTPAMEACQQLLEVLKIVRRVSS
jgi:ankyrin repeat protein